MDNNRISSIEYLDRSDVTSYMKDMLTILLETRPEKPVSFMVEYFRNLVETNSSFDRSYHYIKIALTYLVSNNYDSFLDNMLLGIINN